MEERTYTVEIYKKDGQSSVYISTDGASGCDYRVNSPNDVGKYLADYIESFDIEH